MVLATFSVNGGAQVQKAEFRNAITRAKDIPVDVNNGLISYPSNWSGVEVSFADSPQTNDLIVEFKNLSND